MNMLKKKIQKYDSDSDSDEELNKMAEARNKKIKIQGVQNLKDGLLISRLSDYAIAKYFDTDIITKGKVKDDFFKLNRKFKFKTNKDVDDYFKPHVKPQEEAWFDDYPKKKESKTGKKIKKLIESVEKTKISEPSNKKHFDSISSIMDLVGSLIKKPKEKSYPDINESMSEVNKLT